MFFPNKTEHDAVERAIYRTRKNISTFDKFSKSMITKGETSRKFASEEFLGHVADVTDYIDKEFFNDARQYPAVNTTEWDILDGLIRDVDGNTRSILESLKTKYEASLSDLENKIRSRNRSGVLDQDIALLIQNARNTFDEMYANDMSNLVVNDQQVSIIDSNLKELYTGSNSSSIKSEINTKIFKNLIGESTRVKIRNDEDLDLYPISIKSADGVESTLLNYINTKISDKISNPNSAGSIQNTLNSKMQNIRNDLNNKIFSTSQDSGNENSVANEVSDLLSALDRKFVLDNTQKPAAGNRFKSHYDAIIDTKQAAKNTKDSLDRKFLEAGCWDQVNSKIAKDYSGLTTKGKWSKMNSVITGAINLLK